jgi:hypothetical protein
LDDLHLFYQDDNAAGTDIGVSKGPGQGLATELTDQEAVLLVSQGTQPPAGKEISNGAGAARYLWLSLINSVIHPSVTDVYGATAAAQGRPQANYPALSFGDNNPVTLTIYGHDGGFTSVTTGSADMLVYSLKNEYDSYSPVNVVYSADFEGNTDNWVDRGTMTGFDNCPRTATGTGIGFTAPANNTNVAYGVWMSGTAAGVGPVINVSQAAFNGKLLKVRMNMSTTAASAEATPGFRLLYANVGFTHVGGFFVSSTTGAGDAINTPGPGGKDLFVYFEVPFTLNEMLDGDRLAVANPAQDLRDYLFQFDCVDIDAADAGVLAMEEIEVIADAMPAFPTTLAEWGGSGTAFNATGTGFVKGGDLAGFTAGTVTVTAPSVALRIATGNQAYTITAVPPNASTLPAWTSNKVVKMTTRLATSAINNTPNIRCLTLANRTDGSQLPIIWANAMTYDSLYGVYASTVDQLGGTPTVAGVDFNSYLYTHTAGTGANAGVLQPQIDIYRAALPTNGWPISNATITVSSVKFQQ